MVICLIICTICKIVMMVIAPQIENDLMCMGITVLAGTGYLITFCLALEKEQELKSRIDALEDKLNEKENKK